MFVILVNGLKFVATRWVVPTELNADAGYGSRRLNSVVTIWGVPTELYTVADYIGQWIKVHCYKMGHS
jgi:hypothetical protein